MWLKIKIWTKVLLASAVVLYALLFVYNNTGVQIKFWWWFNHSEEASVFRLALIAFISGGIVAVLLLTTWRTVRQVRELKRRNRQQRVERDLADMKSKAGMLKTKTTLGPTSTPAAPTTPDQHL